MKRIPLFVFALGALAASAGVPVVDPATVSVVQEGPKVTVSYTLTGEEGIVTIDLQTNTLADASGDWISVGPENLRTLKGAVNRRISALGVVQTATWKPGRESLAADQDRLGKVRAVVKAWSVTAPPDYLVVNLKNEADIRYYTGTDEFPWGTLDQAIYRKDLLVMRRIPAAGQTFRMGPARGETTQSDGGTSHFVALTDDYWMSIFPLTQGQAFCVTTSKIYPNWHSHGDTNAFCLIEFSAMRGDGEAGADYDWPTKGHDKVDPASFLGKLRTLSGVEFDMPTEAQWQYACRAGTGTKYYIGKDTLTADERKAISWCNEDVPPATSPERRMARVGVRQPNAWGLCDFYGFMHDRCLDWYQADITTGIDPEKGPTGPESDTVYRVGCGGGWGTGIAEAHSATRNSVGFDASNYREYRVMCPVSLKW